MVNKNNSLGGAATPPEDGQKREHVENPKTLTLISSLTALMLQVKQLADGERYVKKPQRHYEAVHANAL